MKLNQQQEAPARTTIKTIKIGNRSFQLPQPAAAPAEYVQAWETVNRALQADRYRIIAKLDAPDAPAPAGAANYGNFTYGKHRAVNNPELLTPTGAFVGFTPPQVQAELPDMAQRDADPRYGHYVCPLSATRHYILIDDCSPEKQAKADQYHAALTLTSSPGNQQRVIVVDSHPDPEIARLAANKLSAYLNQQCGDPAVKNGQQDFRLPGFYNHKPRRIQPDGTSPRAELVAASGGICPTAQTIYNRYAAEIEQQHQHQTQQRQAQPQQPRQQPTPQTTAAPVSPEWAPCGIMWRDVYATACKQIAHGYARRGVEPPVGHRLDYAIAVRLAVMGYGQGQIATAIAHGAPAAEAARIRTAQGETPDTSRDWNAYAAAKAGEAFAPAGQQQVARYSDKAQIWRREEGRDARQIQREYERAGIEIPAEYQQKRQQQKNERGMEM